MPDVLKPFHTLLLDWWQDRQRDFSWRADNVNPYEILMTEMMLWKTRAAMVETVWSTFFYRYPTIDDLACASEDDVGETIAILGLKRRAQCMIDIASDIVGHYDGIVPKNKDALLGLGVGEYVASAVRCFAFGEDEIVYDANIRRVMKRMFNCCNDDDGRAYAKMLLPSGWAVEWNYALLDLGALICRWRPFCKHDCPLVSICATGAEKGHSIRIDEG